MPSEALFGIWEGRQGTAADDNEENDESGGGGNRKNRRRRTPCILAPNGIVSKHYRGMMIMPLYRNPKPYNLIKTPLRSAARFFHAFFEDAKNSDEET